jgi:CheY-like chemotaxis protein
MKRKEPKYKYNNILLLDDNDLDNFINEKIMESNLFSKKNYICTSGKSDIEFLTNIVEMGEEFSKNYPEIIFVDLNMPLMDGFQFIEFFKKNLESKLHNPKIVILTSSIFPEDELKAEKISKDITFLIKPLTKDILEKL